MPSGQSLWLAVTGQHTPCPMCGPAGFAAALTASAPLVAPALAGRSSSIPFAFQSFIAHSAGCFWCRLSYSQAGSSTADCLWPEQKQCMDLRQSRGTQHRPKDVFSTRHSNVSTCKAPSLRCSTHHASPSTKVPLLHLQQELCTHQS